MSYRLQDGLSFCEVDGHAIFLDTRNDRYFRLCGKMDRMFLAYVNGKEISEVDLATLVEHSILAKAATAGTIEPTVRVDHPTCSVMEQSVRSEQFGIGTILDVFAIVGLTRLQLARRCLGRTLSAAAAYRDSRTSPPSGLPTETEVQRLLHTAAAFWLVRTYVPIEPRCLLDSLAMVRFLAKRGLHSNLIFGVTGNPFSAHAWVQVANVVLTDSVGNVTAHTPIRAM